MSGGGASSALHAALVVFLVVAIPLWDRHETRRLRAEPTSANRVRAYAMTIGWLVAASALLVATTPLRSLLRPPSSPTATAILSSPLALPILIGLGIGLLGGVLAPLVLARAGATSRSGQHEQWRRYAFFLPHGPRERAWFAGVAVAAGVCEEIVYRGFLLRWLMEGPFPLELVPAVLVAAAIFGLGHGYQGWVGVLSTAVLALCFTALFFVAHHLWLPMLFHLLLDLRVLAIWRAEPTP